MAKAAEEKVARDRRIVEGVALNGKTCGEVAKQEKVSVRTVQTVLAEWRQSDRTALAEENPEDVVREALRAFEWLRGQLYDLAATPGIQDTAKVAALRAIGEFRQAELALRQQVGLLPRNMGRFAVELDLNYLTVKLIELFERHGLPKEARGELVTLFRRREADLQLVESNP